MRPRILGEVIGEEPKPTRELVLRSVRWVVAALLAFAAAWLGLVIGRVR